MKKTSQLILIGALVFISPTLHSCNKMQSSISQQQINRTLSPEELQQIAAAITVKVIGGESGGSGTIIRKVGSTYTVVTNQHVLRAVNASSKSRRESSEDEELVKNIRIQTPDGLDYPATIVTGEAIAFQENDLGLLEFNADRAYDVGTFPHSDVALKPGEKVWAAGFPSEPPLSKGGPAIGFVTEGEVSLIPDQALEQGYQLGYSNPIQNGMSGGPIINRHGDIVGFNGRQANPLFGDPFVYADGSKPTDGERQKMVGLSWGLPLSVLAQGAPAMMEEVEPPFTGLAKEVYDQAKAVTVRIEGRDKKNPSLDPIPGSGVIIAKERNTYYVATARHVVKYPNQNYELIAPDGRRYRIDDSKIKQQEGQDLALVPFVSKATYPLATIADYRLKYDDRPWVFAAGWPKGQSRRNQQFAFTAGKRFSSEQSSLVAQNTASLTEGYEMVYKNITQRGMSGGPVLDRQGRLVAIHGRTENGEFGGVQLGLSLGIPANTLLGTLERWGIERQGLQVETTPAPELDENKENEAIDAQFLTVKEPQKDSQARDWIGYGNQLWRGDLSEQAIEAFDKAIQLDPNSYAAWYARGLALRGADRDREAVASFERAIAIDEAPYEAWREKSNALFYGLKQNQEALASIDEAIQRNSRDAVLYGLQGAILQELKRHHDALEAYSKAINMKPHAWAYNDRGVARYESGDSGGAISDYDEAIKIDPQFALAYNNRGVARADSGDSGGAISDYDRAIKINPQDALAYNNRGFTRYASGDIPGAIADYDRAIKIDPQYALAYGNRGVARKNSGDLFGAIDDYDQVIKINPQSALAYNNRGNARSDSGDTGGAIADYDRAIKIDPQFALAYNNRGFIRYESGDLPGAIDDYDRAIKINPQYAKAYGNRGIARSDSGDTGGAIADFAKAIEINPQDAEAYYNRGLARSHLGDIPGAIADYTAAIKINPQLDEAYHNRGVARVKSGYLEGAIADFTKAIEINPQDAKAYSGRGVARYMSGDKQGGIKDMQKAEQLFCQQGKQQECQKLRDLLKNMEAGR